MATLSTADRKALPDSAFAHVGKGGDDRQLPIHDAPHVRAALGGDGLTAAKGLSPSEKKAAASKILAAAKSKGVDVADDNPVKAIASGPVKAAEAKPKCKTCGGKGTIRDGHVKCPDCKGSGVAVPGDDDDDDSGDDGGADMAERCSVLALSFGEQINLAEGKPIPFLVTGSWQFDEYGAFEVTRADLQVVKDNFDADVRQQKLPIINEAHNHDRAIGRIKSLDFAGPDRLVATPDWTPVGERLIADEAYGYTSPELDYRSVLLRNWANPEQPAVKHPIVAAGLALTNFPKIKKLGAIAASETAGGCDLIACSERIPAGDHPMRIALAMAEDDPDHDGDDDGTVPCCIYQPPVASAGCCPGYTRRPKDTDGDGTCLFADQGCNGYRPVVGDLANQQMAAARVGNLPTGMTLLPQFSERNPKENAAMPETPPKDQPGDTGAKTGSEQPDGAALMAENATLSAKFAESEKQRVDLAERVSAMERERTEERVTARFAELVKTGRITPAEREQLCGEKNANLIKLSENDFVIATLEARKPNSAVPLAEIGQSASSDGGPDATAQLANFAEEIRKTDPKLTVEQARVQAMAEHPEVYEAARQARLSAAQGVR